MAAPLSHRVLRGSAWAAVALSTLLATALAAAAQSTAPSSPPDSHPLQEVQVTTSKLDRQTLKRVVIQFVKLHAAASPVIHQLGRWRLDVCPRVTGLNTAASEFVSSRVQEVARSVGAPTPHMGKKCRANVEIVFSSEPQQLLNHIANSYPWLLGSSRSAGDTVFHHAIQAWYLTGTRADHLDFAQLQLEYQLVVGAAINVLPLGVNVDPAYGQGFAPVGLAGSYFTKGLTSEILEVLVIVDSGKVAGDSLRSISDYIAMLALTRMSSLDGCSELPSIIDLLSSGCVERAKPEALTETDTAYLKALYSSDLEMSLNIEQADMRDRMVTFIAGK